jgi:predicted nucleic acid-binding protein
MTSPSPTETAALVDSSFFVRQQRFGLDGFVELAQWCRHFELLSCGMVRMEVLHGTRSTRALQRYTELFAVMREIPTTPRTWDRAIEIARQLTGTGTPIPPQAALIAAHALEAGAAIITLDTDYRRVPGLTVLQRLP